MECDGKLGHGRSTHVHPDGPALGSLGYRKPADAQFRAFIWQSAGRPRHYRYRDRTAAGRYDRHHRSIGCTASTPRPACHVGAKLRQVLGCGHRLRRRHLGHSDTAEHHVGVDG